jgi:DNA-binding NarL/FixJ family response regulator
MVVDDHPVVRRGLAYLINQEGDLIVCGEAEDAHEALAQVQKQRPDLAIVDLVLKQSSGIDLVKELKRRYPKLPVLVISMHEESLYAERALRAGAKGYIMKHEVDEVIMNAIRRVLKGEIYVSSAVSERILQSFTQASAQHSGASVQSLSDRELEVFHLIGRGVKTREIAERLHVSTKTVETYRARIKLKLHLSSSGELTQFAVEWLLRQPRP